MYNKLRFQGGFMNIYFDNLQLILNSDNTDEDKQNQLLDLIKSIENDLL